MKFGGASISTGDRLRRLADIVSEHMEQRPVVVVSAMGNTTDRLIDTLSDAKWGHSYGVWHGLKELQEYHLEQASEAVSSEAMERLEVSVRLKFRDLHLKLMAVSEDGQEVTPQLWDEVLSYGERLSSEIVTLALQTAGIRSLWVDARDLILTDNRHMNASPLVWETYARMRRVIPIFGQDHVVVMGGFIGATESGVTTTLGRSGSDLTATLVGAGIAADEVQLWKEVDGVLTCDPRIGSGLLVKSLSYTEATAMARGGAKILHPKAMQPLIRQNVPVAIHNTNDPKGNGTRIGRAAVQSTNGVKTITVRQNLTVLEIRNVGAGPARSTLDSVCNLCERRQTTPELAICSQDVAYVGLRETHMFSEMRDELEDCVQVHLRPEYGVITLVGEDVSPRPGLMDRITSALAGFEAQLIRDEQSTVDLHILVPQASVVKAAMSLHHELFQDADPAVFVAIPAKATPAPVVGAWLQVSTPKRSRARVPITSFRRRSRPELA